MTDAARVEDHDRRLVCTQRLDRHAHVAHVAQAGVQPVHELRPVDESIDDGARRSDPLTGRRAELNARPAGDLDELVRLKRRVVDGHAACRWRAGYDGVSPTGCVTAELGCRSTHGARHAGGSNGSAQ